jgi:hypothetical protein
MRWNRLCYAWGVLGLFLLASCPDRTDIATPIAITMMTFRYDGARDVVIATTRPLAIAQPVTSQRFANALALASGVSYTPAANLRLANPVPTVNGAVLTVDYRDVAGLGQLASAQVNAILAALEAWWWVPGITEIQLQAAGQPITTLGPLTISQPLRREYHTYVIQPQTGEVGYLVGSLTPPTLTEAVRILRARQISEFPATQGFQPLLPPEIDATTGTVKDGTLPVNLTAPFSTGQSPRLAGMILMLTQYPEIEAVQYTFAGETTNAPFMRGNLNAPLSSQQLLLPSTVASIATAQQRTGIEAAVVAHLGAQPASIGQALIWRDWAKVAVTPTPGVPVQQYVMHQGAQGYTVQTVDAGAPSDVLLARGVTREAIIAFRLQGWEELEKSVR